MEQTNEMNGNKTRIVELISKFSISLVGENLKIYNHPTQNDVAELRARKAEIIAELETRIQIEKEKIESAKRATAQKLADLKSGVTKISLFWSNGEVLCGYMAKGQGSDLLEELGLAAYVSGWGILVNSEVFKALGEEFTYQQAVEFSQPKRDAEAKKEAEREQKIQEKFFEAKETGKAVLLSKYMDGCSDSEEECNTDIVAQYAMPDGSTKMVRNHTW